MLLPVLFNYTRYIRLRGSLLVPEIPISRVSGNALDECDRLNSSNVINPLLLESKVSHDATPRDQVHRSHHTRPSCTKNLFTQNLIRSRTASYFIFVIVDFL